MHLLLVDDDEDLCKMLTAYLSVEGFSTATVGDGREGVTAALSGQYDAVILDIMLPTLSGIGALREIRRSSDVPVIMLTARGDNLDRIAGLDFGADDYVAKPYDPRELVARLRAVLRRRTLKGTAPRQECLSLLGLVLSSSTRRVSWNDRSIELTASEFNVLEALMRAEGAVKSKDELSLEALGRRREPYDRCLDVHISNLRQKLLIKGACEIEIETVRGVGYRIKAT